MIALDLDGTLEDSRDDMVAAVHRVRAARDLPPLEDGAIRPNVSRGMPHLYATCLPELDDAPAAYATAYSAGIADSTRLYPGMREALAALPGPLAVVTNKPEALSALLLEALGVREMFSAIVGGDSCAEAKPSPVMLQEAVERCGGGPIVMVGDSGGDIRMARAYGCPVVWAGWGYYDTAPGQPDATASEPSDLPGVVRALLASS